jgi:two-component system cell cycle sensor histidine kinase/response regulator CckA
MILRRSRRLAERGWMIDRLAERLSPLEAVLFDAPDTGLLAIDRAGRVVRANAWLRRRLHSAAEPRAGVTARELFVPADRDRVRAFLDDAASGARAAEPLGARMPAADGAEMPVSLTAQVLRESDQAISGLLLRITDQSGALRLEADLAHGQKMQAMGQLAAGIAHDFNNLLTAVIGSADAALDRGGQDGETRADLRQIRLAGDRGSALVRQVLAFSRRQPLQPRVIAVNDAVRALAELLPRMLGAPHRLALELEEPGRRVRVDPAQFDQILVNLAMNARDAMPQGGTLTLRTGHRTVYRPQPDGLETIAPGRYVLIEATDTGIGIAPDILPHIFEPFFTTRRQSGGSGLGLATVHGIVRQSGGFVTVESQPNQGTTIRIYLLRHDAAAAETPADAAAAETPADAAAAETPADAPVADEPPAPGLRGTALLVEDEAPVRALAERALRQAGWTVLAAESAEAALARIDAPGEPRIDLLISDIVLPGMDGPALLARLRARGPNLPAILQGIRTWNSSLSAKPLPDAARKDSTHGW